MSNSSFIIERATTADIPALGKIFADAFAEDRNTQLKYLHEGPEAPYEMMCDALQSWMGKPEKCPVVKVVESGEILGWMCWGYNGYDGVAKPAAVEKGHDDEGEHPFRDSPHIVLSIDNQSKTRRLWTKGMKAIRKKIKHQKRLSA